MAARPVVGLDIGTSGVRAAELTLGKGGTTLERFGQVALPAGAVRDGEVIEPEAVATALHELWAQAGFRTKRVVVGVANQRVVVRQVELPWLPPAEFRDSLVFQVQDFIPMPVDQAILDYHPLEEFVDDAGARMLRILLVAASRDMVNTALQAVELAGLRPTAVDLTSFAVLRSLVADASEFGPYEAEALIDIGSSITNIVVHQGRVPRFVRILLMGGGDITEALSERLGVPVESAEAYKRALGLGAADTIEEDPAVRAIQTSGGALVEEVRGSLDYYMAQPGAVRIGRVVLSGGGSQLAGLADRLAQATRLPVEAARPMSTLLLGRTGLSPEQLRLVEPSIAVPLGLALGKAS